jgi:hypothetical protein
MPRRIPVHDLHGRLVASVQGDALLVSAHSSRHMLKAPRGWAFNVEVLAAATRLGARRVVITDLDDSRATYAAWLSAFDRDGIRLDRGAGQQVALPLAFWAISRQGEESAKPRPVVIQEALL